MALAGGIPTMKTLLEEWDSEYEVKIYKMVYIPGLVLKNILKKAQQKAKDILNSRTDFPFVVRSNI